MVWRTKLRVRDGEGGTNATGNVKPNYKADRFQSNHALCRHGPNFGQPSFQAYPRPSKFIEWANSSWTQETSRNLLVKGMHASG